MLGSGLIASDCAHNVTQPRISVAEILRISGALQFAALEVSGSCSIKTKSSEQIFLS